MTPADPPAAPRRRPTQTEIARIAGVSQATVSLVLNGRDDELSEATRQRVREVLQRVGYVANPVARVLAGGQNRILGIHTFEQVFPLHSGDFYFPFLLGVEEEAERQGYDLLMFTSAGGSRRVFSGGATRLELADGSLLLGRRPDLEEIGRLAEMEYPFVYIGHRDLPGRGISYVAADYATATAEATRRLLEAGHRRIAYVRYGESVGQPGIDRLEGFRAVAREERLTSAASPLWNVDGPADVEGLLDDVRESHTTALLVEQQQLAELLRAACRSRGLRIPDDLSIAVLGDSIGAQRPDPGWSGFHVPRREMGASATRLLIAQLRGDVAAPAVRSIPCRTVDGSTIAAPRTAPGAARPAARRAPQPPPGEQPGGARKAAQ
ncbi:LacI family DNA-binding transcriptional regulator [Streptomyces sp. CA-111067]|uniref:LacI family DNA-binding transcriptional regulator n=1 Tax=Streptomyces sp. CA-111067 TaxID=3240046 RepID=UPI003D99151B